MRRIPPLDAIPAVRAFDDAVDAAIGRVRGPALDRLAYRLSSAADHSLVWFLSGATHAWRRGDARFLARFGIAMLGESVLTNGVVKSVFGRTRPDDGYARHEPLPYGMRRPITSSFPSGHATAAFTATTLLARAGGNRAWYLLAAAVAASRVYVKMHHASDVIVGAAMGVGLGRLATRPVLGPEWRQGRPG